MVSEKIDGTNASVFIPQPEEADKYARKVMAGSRNRWLEPGDDNYGFAAWVEMHWEELLQLGPGHHFGEWWGKGIQRNYGMTERRFSLFNVAKWSDPNARPSVCHVVPVLYTGPFYTTMVDVIISALREKGSVAAPGFMDPEGIIIYHTAANYLFKKTVKGDEMGKSQESHVRAEPKEPKVRHKGDRRQAQLPIDFPDRRKQPHVYK